ncbi:glucosamine 6-phosphate N-acetyltransferase-like [Glandiceps talaboti]
MENGPLDETPLFRPGLLKEIDFSKVHAKFKPPVSPTNPGEDLVMRPLCPADFDKGFMTLLTQLTVVGDVSREQFLARYNQMKACPDTYYIVVIEDTSTGKIVGTGSVIKEQKFIRACGARGKMEEFVVDSAYRGKQLGKLLFETLFLLANEIDCYKCSLTCKPENIAFYEKFGFKVDPESFMQYRF